MTSTKMHFGPEWMRNKPQQTPTRSQLPPSPPPPNLPASASQSASTYSALVSSASPEPEIRDEAHPFRYSKEEMLRIYRESGGKGGLGLEVERWEGIVSEHASEPISLREMSEAEKKLFAGPLNSELRRRQSSDYLSTSYTASGDRPRLSHSASAQGSPLRERFGPLMSRRRDSTDHPPSILPRKQSLSASQGPLSSPRDGTTTTSRTRISGFASGFDGVLNNGDSWVARRRNSEAMLKAGLAVPSTPRGEHGNGDNRGLEIKEEVEEFTQSTSENHTPKGRANVTDAVDAAPSSSTHALKAAHASDDVEKTDISSVSSGMAALNLSNGSSASVDSSSLQAPAAIISGPISGPPPGLPDLASIEWSYLDPQGQVQGPFRADLMQKWHDEGYFARDLLLKRTHMDTDWIAVGELDRQLGGGKIFLSRAPVSGIPPGLASRTDSPLHSFTPPQDQNMLSSPFQPTPTRGMRMATLDSYLPNGHNLTDSPSSPFDVAGFAPSSSDSSAFGSRTNSLGFSDDHIGRGFGTPQGPPYAGGRGSALQDQAIDFRAPSFDSFSAGRNASMDNFGFNDTFNNNHSPWTNSNPSGVIGPGAAFDPVMANRGQGTINGPFSSGFNGTVPGAMNSTGNAPDQNNFSHMHAPRDMAFGEGNTSFSRPDYGVVGGLGAAFETHLMGPTSPADGSIGVNGLGHNHISVGQVNNFTNQTPFTSSAPLQLPNIQQHQTISPFGEPLTQPLNPHENNQAPSVPIQPTTPSLPWNIPDAAPSRRTRPFEAPVQPNIVHTANEPPAPAPQNSQPPPPRARDNQPPTTRNTVTSPWVAASLGVTDDGWREMPGPNSLTFSNLGHHNQMLQEQEAAVSTLDSTPIGAERLDVPAAVGQPKARRKSSARDAQALPAVFKPVPATMTNTKIPPESPSSPPAQPKPAWSLDEDSKKAKPSGSGPSLREIQELEAKMAEARKAAEKERERLARLGAVPAPAGDVQPFTASWGLPTSQAGVARPISTPKEAAVPGTTLPAASNAPVWTSAAVAPPAKKSMKEIQEEEERQKKLAVKETMASAAGRRAYAETTTKVAAPPQTGGAWTTVGANGKAIAPSAPAPSPAAPATRPPAVPGSSSANIIIPSNLARPNGIASARPMSATKVPATFKTDDSAPSPSLDFLKWLSDSLKGLNNSVNLEEITSMLLTFPVEPDATTTEIISDLIYANSTTLDGRRFAAEFVNKRKADVVSRKVSIATGAAVGKSASIADIVKAQPKPTQPEWGGFKVVNKKKKSGRT